MEKTLRIIERLIPRTVYKALQPYYHYVLARTGAIRYKNPSSSIFVIGITGTKGKSSTTEFVNATLEAAGKKTAILSTIRFKIGDKSRPNKFKMTMPGRFFTQQFLRDAVNDGCEYATIEMTSEGARFYRHIGVELDALIFTNLSPEHIESHGSFEKYKEAKLRLVKQLVKSKKPIRIAIANIDNEHAKDFLPKNIEHSIGYSLSQATIKEETQDGSTIRFEGETITIPLPGRFNISNTLAALSFAKAVNIPIHLAKEGIENLSLIRGRVEKVQTSPLQDFTVIVDYAHTEDSLRKLYETFNGSPIIAVLGGTGGGRDAWKRPVMGALADNYAKEVIVTDEDPYDENPRKIMDEVASGVTKHAPIIMEDRRKAIAHAISIAQPGDVVLITGKGTDPYIMRAQGEKEVWDDASVAREELLKRYKN
jgi:UDP-N-acetylmuramoyl-L-alanyl-D-glutamate--2,6-diaminopimelate ligase